MVIYDNRLISEEHNFSEDTLSEWVLEACEFAFDNFKEKNGATARKSIFGKLLLSLNELWYF